DRGIRPRVLVTVPVLTLLGVSDEPATLEGYGPIDHDTAMRLAATAPSFTRLLTHPETGAVLSVGRDRYTVPADLRTWLRVRDGTCRFPWCSRAARICEIDHTKDWLHNGQTAHDNLAHLCPAHHRLKHQTRWTVAQSPGGVLKWTSPNGRAYATEPETRMQSA
ncbi:MAG TPA: HNH endonuclease signature motif containing protein, partial [Rhodoglobus sp.]|nr:HNH endonuclease signature motif containing protein [Rhodoglobus sp.]